MKRIRVKGKATPLVSSLFLILLLIATGSIWAQQIVTLKAISNGERVRLSYKGKSKVVKLEEDFGGDFVAGGDPPHHYTTLLTIEKSGSFYLLAKFRSGPAISNPNAPCGGDRPSTWLLIKANKDLKVEAVQTVVYDSCIYNGSGRYPKGRLKIIGKKVTILFEEGRKLFELFFDGDDPGKGLQVNPQEKLVSST